jgi:hypothetical protein
MVNTLVDQNSRADRNYTVFRHAEIFRNYFFLKDFLSFVKENEESSCIFWNVIFVKMQASK